MTQPSIHPPERDGATTTIPISPVNGHPVADLDGAWARHAGLRTYLDRWCEGLQRGPGVWQTLDELDRVLTEQRDNSSPESWPTIVALCRQHPLRDVIHLDPFTEWSFRKPRGYPGDATLLDLIYHHPDARRRLQETPPLGRAIYAHTSMVAACRAVRHRRDLVAARIDEICFTRASARILSVACGNLREAACSNAVAGDHLATMIALDHDPESLAQVARAYAGRRVEPRQVSIRQILAGKFTEHDFDFIYTAGLYDYLADRAAQRFTRILFDKLKPGGKLLIANFLDTVPNRGYMEIYMDWFLILRSRDQFRSVVDNLAGNEAVIREFVDDSGSIAYLEIERI